jgi:hypothetical protein
MTRRQKTIGCVVVLLAAWPLGAAAQTEPRRGGMPVRREARAAERQDLEVMIRERFRPRVRGELQVRAAGAYLFAATEDFFVIKRTDVNSVAFGTKAYGVSDEALDPNAISKEALLGRVDQALSQAGFEIRDKKFAHFQDEFAGAFHGRKEMPADFDPRKASKHLARTVAFERVVEGLPVFGSELIVGLDPEGRIGRFRLHWPKLSPAVVKAAHALESASRAKKWVVPKRLQDRDTEILEATPGVGHSAFADPGFRSAAVVRILYRKTGRAGQYPLATTGYVYIDAQGRDVVFSAFPRIPGTPAIKKARAEAGR